VAPPPLMPAAPATTVASIRCVEEAVIEIGETFFWIWLSQRHRVRMGAETLIGARAEVVTPCRPEGQVRIQGELWRARCEGGAELGDQVRVVERSGLTLLVEQE